jgi:alpha-mannosidase
MMSSPIAGFNAVYFARDDWQEQGQREKNKTTEMIWAPSSSLGMNGATFAGVLYGGYCTIGGIDMSINSNDTPLMDDPTLEDFNVAAVVDGVVSHVADAISKYPNGEPGGDGTMDVMFPLGCDFEYENSATWYTNTDKLIHWLNQDGRVNAFYSSPSLYTDAKLENGKSYSIKANEDFMNYAGG